MGWRTSKIVMQARNFGRALGLNRLAAGLMAGKNYEDRFQKAMLGTIRAGDVVWDVGANVGLYSVQFAELVGPQGMVIAFEPSPTNLASLTAKAASVTNIRILPVGLGERDGDMAFEQGVDDLGATSRVVGSAALASNNQVVVRIRGGDGLIASGEVPVPTIMKIDTEGFELDVLLGLQNTLQATSLRALCIEMHFGLLEQRGLSRAAAQIENMLADSGFSVAWPDASHIVATRMP